MLYEDGIYDRQLYMASCDENVVQNILCGRLYKVKWLDLRMFLCTKNLKDISLGIVYSDSAQMERVLVGSIIFLDGVLVLCRIYLQYLRIHSIYFYVVYFKFLFCLYFLFDSDLQIDHLDLSSLEWYCQYLPVSWDVFVQQRKVI
eukprot:TRINITY_DN7803_c0_g1_i3.p2 TRINITY_DN7803_c0_g1~~TRINITY_DN7803_c0_g1_i3.p2  ORF type:complete len:145 (+),score=3.11 TRINITY_DN7803_c0_g1_i3:711-1145(+)